MSSSNCCFLTWIQISQEAGQVVWYSHLLKNFSYFVVIYTVKGFSVVNEAEAVIFLECSCFFYDSTDVDNLISGSSAFSKPSLYIGKFRFTCYWSLPWRIFTITLLACVCMHGKLFQSCLTLCNLMDCSPPSCSVHWILQARKLEWVTMPSSRGSSQPRDQTCIPYISCIGITTSPTWEALLVCEMSAIVW